jgi:uncharacterized protein
VLWRALTNIRTHRQVLQLLKLPAFAQPVQANPKFAFKYLTQDYLVQGFTVAERAACFLHHYRRLNATLPDCLLRQILNADVTLHEVAAAGGRFAVTIGLSRPYYKEGELSLSLLVDNEVVFVLSFTIVPGWVLKSDVAEILLITRIQGMKGCYEQIALATKAMHDVAPSALLLAALQGVGTAFGIGELAAVSAVRQTSYTEDTAADFQNAYDDFFLNVGLDKNADGFFMSPIPLEEKPLAAIKQGHKLRTKKKRAFKQRILAACEDAFLEMLPDDKRNSPS